MGDGTGVVESGWDSGPDDTCVASGVSAWDDAADDTGDEGKGDRAESSKSSSA